MKPTDGEALAALRVVAAWLGVGATTASAVHDQDDLPPGVTRDGFLRLHRARTRERVGGWTRRGKARLVTSEAWAREVERETAATRRSRPPLIKARGANDSAEGVDEKLDAALGIRTRRTTG